MAASPAADAAEAGELPARSASASPASMPHEEQATTKRPTGMSWAGMRSKCSVMLRWKWSAAWRRWSTSASSSSAARSSACRARLAAEQRRSLLGLPPAAVLDPRPLGEGAFRGRRSSTQLGVEAGEQPEDEGRRCPARLARLRLGCADGDHPAVAVVVDEAHLDVVDRQPVPPGRPGEAVAEAADRPFLEDPGLCSADVRRLQLPHAAPGCLPLDHSSALHSGSRTAATRVASAHRTAATASSASRSW